MARLHRAKLEASVNGSYAQLICRYRPLGNRPENRPENGTSEQEVFGLS